jgi:GTP-binding protein
VDIPGIIEGAHEVSGLGLQFLKHIARTACLPFSRLVRRKLAHRFPDTPAELELFSPELAKKTAHSSGDEDGPAGCSGTFCAVQALFSEETVYGISVFSGLGLDALKQVFFKRWSGMRPEGQKESMRRSACSTRLN